MRKPKKPGFTLTLANDQAQLLRQIFCEAIGAQTFYVQVCPSDDDSRTEDQIMADRDAFEALETEVLGAMKAQGIIKFNMGQNNCAYCRGTEYIENQGNTYKCPYCSLIDGDKVDVAGPKGARFQGAEFLGYCASNHKGKSKRAVVRCPSECSLHIIRAGALICATED